MPVYVPSFADKWVKAASQGSGLPYDLVACHIDSVSGFDSRAISPDGREGPYQFAPSVFYAAWHGSPLSWADSTVAYGLVMSSLLRRYHGDVRQALAAFRSAPGDAGTGLAWAERVMECAGYEGAASGGRVPAPLTAAELTDPNVQADDWSWYVARAGDWMTQLGDTARYWAGYIGGL